jgi:peptide/nickel transport system permease protein
MSALTSPLSSGPDAIAEISEAVISRRRSFLDALPLKAKIGAVILLVFIMVAIFGPWLAPFDPSATTAGQALPLAPTGTHLLGTTATGGDVLSQLLAGTRSTVVLGLLTGVIATVLAVAVGTSAGFLGGLADEGLSLLANVFRRCRCWWSSWGTCRIPGSCRRRSCSASWAGRGEPG